MNLTDQIAEMLRVNANRLDLRPDGSARLHQLIDAGLIQKRGYDLAPVDVFGSDRNRTKRNQTPSLALTDDHLSPRPNGAR